MFMYDNLSFLSVICYPEKLFSTPIDCWLCGSRASCCHSHFSYHWDQCHGCWNCVYAQYFFQQRMVYLNLVYGIDNRYSFFVVFFLMFSPVHLWNFSRFFPRLCKISLFQESFFFSWCFFGGGGGGGGWATIVASLTFFSTWTPASFLCKASFWNLPSSCWLSDPSLGNSKPGRFDRLVRWDLIPPAGAQYRFWARTSTSRIKCSINCATWPPLSQES